MEVSTAELQWWLLAVLLYGVGDYVTTVLAVRRADVVEANPRWSHCCPNSPRRSALRC